MVSPGGLCAVCLVLTTLGSSDPVIPHPIVIITPELFNITVHYNWCHYYYDYFDHCYDLMVMSTEDYQSSYMLHVFLMPHPIIIIALDYTLVFTLSQNTNDVTLGSLWSMIIIMIPWWCLLRQWSSDTHSGCCLIPWLSILYWIYPEVYNLHYHRSLLMSLWSLWSLWWSRDDV